jgi:hypothetical protein
MDADERVAPAAEPEPKPVAPPPPKPGIPAGTPDWWGHPDAPWDTHTIRLWVSGVDAVPWRQVPGGYAKTLPCPRCTHDMTVELYGGGIETYDLEPPDRDLRQPATGAVCNCETDKSAHTGRPDEETTGCGQSGPVKRP